MGSATSANYITPVRRTSITAVLLGNKEFTKETDKSSQQRRNKADAILNRIKLCTQPSCITWKRTVLECQLIDFLTSQGFEPHPHLDESDRHCLTLSWNMILHPKNNKNSPQILTECTSSITPFFDAFYSRLERKSKGMFQLFSEQGEKCQSKMLLHSIDFCLNLKVPVSMETNNQIQVLWEFHKNMGIYPSLLSLYLRTLLETIFSFLGERLTTDIARSWINILSFILKALVTECAKNGMACGGILRF
mmetsp:Transcript_28844/g.37911  ORF Transcript_28844/g.37911 Transcript_28844/m.37911 type:complete len:249 (+) Transcript_28844:143-889(+)